MTERRNQNSVLFLTTLGVYLGLLLVGGTAPQVFAHSAVTRVFELNDEIEHIDDLDDKPDPTRSDLLLSVRNYLEDVEFFLGSLRSLEKSGKFVPGTDSFEVSQATLLPCVAGNKVGSYTTQRFVSANKLAVPALELFGKNLTDGYGLGDCLPHDRFEGGSATSSRFNFRFDVDELRIDLSVVKRNAGGAKQLVDELGSSFRFLRQANAEKLRVLIASNTSLIATKETVLIVTRLPRASLIIRNAHHAE